MLGEGGEDLTELTAELNAEPLELMGIERAEVLVERIDEDTEGKIALELGGAPGENNVAAGFCKRPELCEQAALADSGPPAMTSARATPRSTSSIASLARRSSWVRPTRTETD